MVRQLLAKNREYYKLALGLFASPRQVVFTRVSSHFPRYFQLIIGTHPPSFGPKFTVSEVSPVFFAQSCRLVSSPWVYSAGATFLQLGEDLRALGFTLDMC